MAPTAITKGSRSRLRDIIVLLQDKGESLAACRSRLSLTCKEIEDICCLLYSSSPQSNSLVDLLENVKAIRILPEPASSLTAAESSPINLSPFHKLTHLEVRNVAISRIVNLSQLRSQLVQLVLHACTDSLDRVLRECGGDKCTDSFLWSELHSLHITSYRSLDLGTGLFLAPWLKTLDLTFNELTDNSIQSSLSSLLTLHTLVLNCNSLQRIPVLAPSARTSLKVLHLRQNQLDSLNGIEQLHSIEELDVAYNCISNGEALSSLSFLPLLTKLSLEFNPLSYVKDYRLVVLRRVSASVNRKRFLLDDKPLSASDKETVGTMAALYVHPPTITVRGDEIQSTPPTSNDSKPTPSPGLLNSTSYESFPTTPITPAASSSSLSAVKRRKASRMREVEIADQPIARFPEDDEEVAEPLVAEPTGDNEMGHLQTKQQVEELRRVFGQENWLTSQAGNQVRLLLGWQDGGTSDVVESREDKEDAIVVLDSEMEPFVSQQVMNESKDDEEESDHLFVFVVQRQINSSQTLDERLLAVSTQYLYEKDVLTGATLACWKRSCLQSVTLVDKEQSVVKVQLAFYPPTNESIYYVMDQDDYEEMEKLAVSDGIADTSMNVINDVTQSRVDMSCMKCDQKFPSVQAAVRLRTVVSSPLLKGQLEEYSVCPYCASDMVFAIERQPSHVDSSESSMSSSSSSSGSDVVVATNDPYSPVRSGGRCLDKSSDEDSVKVMDKTSRLTSFTPNVEIIKSAAKSLSSRSHSSSKSSGRSNKSTTPKPQSSTPLFTYSYADFSQVDHRLRLYCEMFLLSHHAEEFHGLVKADLVTTNAGPTDEEMLPYPALLVVTSYKVYFLRITAPCSEQPEKWLNLESSFPLGQLVTIMSLIGHQGLVLKFGNTASHLLLLRDQRRTRNVIVFLTDVYEKSGLAVPALRTDLMSDQWLALDGLVRGDQQSVNDDVESTGIVVRSDSSSRVFLFCVTCRVEWGNHLQQPQTDDYNNTALMVTSDRMALVRGDPRWLMSHQVQFRTWGVSILSLQQLVNLVSLESFVSKPEQLRCYFLDEASGMEEKWTVSLATREAVDQLIEAVRYPWEAVFSVELEINELDE